MKNIQLICPICNIQKIQSIPDIIVNDAKNQQNELTSIQIPIKVVCNHSFIVNVDHNFNIVNFEKLAIFEEITDKQKRNEKNIIKYASITNVLSKMNKNTIHSILTKL